MTCGTFKPFSVAIFLLHVNLRFQEIREGILFDASILKSLIHDRIIQPVEFYTLRCDIRLHATAEPSTSWCWYDAHGRISSVLAGIPELRYFGNQQFDLRTNKFVLN